MSRNDSSLVAVIGAGPVGLAAAAHLLERGLTPVLFERGSATGAAIAEWAHVRVFSPWKYNVDAVARSLLERSGWRMPDPDALPTGGEIIRDYLAPLAALPQIASRLNVDAEVVAIVRQDRSRLSSGGRDGAPFAVVWKSADGARHRTIVDAVIDASGTWTRPNPIGVDGLAVDGELENADRIAYGIPDVRGVDRSIYADRHTLIVGGGHSAINAALDLIDLQGDAPATRITWATKAGGIERLLGGGGEDALPGRGQLGLRAETAVRSGSVELRSPFTVRALERVGEALRVRADDGGKPTDLTVDRIVVATGFRPDLTMLGELRLSLDPIVEATPALAPLIDPNLHSCGTVRPHGVVELTHPEKDFYIVGAKSYGRAPTFLMLTGYEQVRSVVAEIAGDHAAARDVRLELPETGVCTSRPLPGDSKIEIAASPPQAACCGPVTVAEPASCCGGKPESNQDACCRLDEEAKASGKSGCGCGDNAELSGVPAS